MKTFLDIGMGKTGSKARQRFFLSQLARVRGVRVSFAETGRMRLWHRPLFEAIRAGDGSLLKDLEREFEATGPATDAMVLSCENMHELETEQIRGLAQVLPHPRAVIFLRRQDQLINSAHNQMHKAHRVSLAALEDFERKMLDFEPAFDYRAILQRWSDVLGRDCVLPVVFDKRVSSVRAFFRRIQVDVDWAGYEERYPNRAMDEFGMAVLRWVKRLAPADVPLPEVMTAAHDRLKSHFVTSTDLAERYTLTLDQRRRIMSYYEASNEWVRREFFPEQPQLFPELEPGQLVRPDYSQGRELAEQIVAAPAV